MKRHNISIAACSLLLLGVVAGCSPQVDDYFDLPASARLKKNIDHAYEVLRSAEYGWEFEYYPGESLDYGGIIYTVKFDSLTATVGCSLIPDSVQTSYYRMSNDNGPVLTFDTFNELFHFYSTPSSSEYQAKGGEFEFVIDSVASDFISVYGKKTGNTMYLRKLAASPDDYAEKTIAVFDHFVDSIKGNVGGTELEGKVDPASRRIHLVAGQDTASVFFTFTDKGIRLYRPLRLGDVRIQNLAFDQQTNTLACTDQGAEGITLQGIPYASDFMNYSRYESDYILSYNSGTAVPVHLKANRLEGNYLLQGLSPNYDLVLNYQPDTGNLTLGSQMIGEIGEKAVYWVCYDYDSGLLSLSDEGQFTISWNKNKFYPMFNFTATNPNQLNCSGGLLIYLYVNDSGSTSAAILDDTSWLTNGSPTFRDLKSLNRRTKME